MERVYVTSSNIRSVMYHEESSVLEIEFKDGSAYEYFDVPTYEYDGLIAADSKGKYANQNIYKRYRQNKIR